MIVKVRRGQRFQRFSTSNGWQLYVYHVLKFGHELIVAFLRHIFHFL